MNSTSTLEPPLFLLDEPSSETWSGNSPQPFRYPRGLTRLMPAAGVVLALATSTVTALQDVWFIDRRKREISTTYWLNDQKIGKPISRVEALRIAKRILARAEQERREIAELDAVCGIQWGD